MALIQALRTDAQRLNASNVSLPNLAKLFVTNSSFAAVAIFRISSALRDSKPEVARILSKMNLILHGIDIDYRARIGPGALFAHPVGVVIGGDCTIGTGATFMSGVVLGRKDVLNGPDMGMYPTTGSNVLFGTGATVLGPVHVGDHSKVGAHALVLEHVPPNSLATGSPATTRILEPRN
jgi:serine O-acetyltransferase